MGQLLTFHIGIPSFSRLRALLKTAPYSHEEICNLLGMLIKEAAANPQALDDDARLLLVTAACVYMVRTQSYEKSLADKMQLNQFLVLVYPGRRQASCRINGFS